MAGTATTPVPNAQNSPATQSANPRKPADDWLKSRYLEVSDGDAASELTVRDFINYLRNETPKTAYFTNEMVDWALEAVRLSRNIKKSSDTVIASIDTSRILYAIGAGFEKDEEGALEGITSDAPVDIDRETNPTTNRKPRTLQEQYSEYFMALHKKRYVFLPVNNGFASERAAYENHNAKLGETKDDQTKADKNKHGKTEKSRRKVEKPEKGKTKGKTKGNKNGGKSSTGDEDNEDVEMLDADTDQVLTTVPKQGLEIGSHWSFIVIDTVQGTARYIDSLVDVVSLEHKRYQLSNMDLNAPVAGKILCGFDTFMKRNKGQFTASTLKWVPNQFRDNKTKQNDAGACGPYLYALMEFILKMRSDTLGPKGVKGYFNEDGRVNNFKKIAFNSYKSRQDIQKRLTALRKTKEVAGDSSTQALHPINLDPKRLLDVLNPEILQKFLTGEVLKHLLNVHESRIIGDGGLAALRAQMGSAGPQDGEWNKRQQWTLVNDFMLEKVSVNEFREMIWNVREDLRVAYNTAYGLDPNDLGPPDEDGAHGNGSKSQPPTRNQESNKLIFPEGITANNIPNDFADEEEVSDDALEQWKAANEIHMGLIFPPKDKKRATSLSYRAALQALSGKTFKLESDERIEKIWRFEPYAIDQGREWSTREIRELLYQKYEQPSGVQETGGSGKPPGDDDGSNGTNSSHPTKPDNKTKEPKESGKGNPDGQGNGGGASIQDGTIPSGKEISPGKTRKITYLTGIGPENLPDFAKLPNSVGLAKWRQLNTDLWKDRDAPKIAIVTQRALLHRTYKGSFKQESDSTLREVWYKDPHAFTKDEQAANWTPSDIAKRMDEVYVDLNPPLFATLTEDEVKIWMKNLPNDIRGQMTHRKGTILYERARGLLHRLFVGEFAELREQKANSKENLKLLEDWRGNDPRCSKKKFPTTDAAVNQLEYLYDTEGTIPLPFLRASPLHWPSREYLLGRGEKRKQIDDDASNATKKINLGRETRSSNRGNSKPPKKS